MAWTVRLDNNQLGEITDIPGSELTEQKAFDKAVNESQKWWRLNWDWDKNNPTPNDPNGGDIMGPAPGGRFKWYYDTEISGQMFVNLRYDYIDSVLGDPQTNDIIWWVVEI